MYKKIGIFGMFIFLIIILLVKPYVIHTIYDNILGRLMLISLVIFLTMNSVTLGLLAALCLIIASNMFFNIGSYNLIEGLDNMNTNTGGVTIGDDNNINSGLNDTINIVPNGSLISKTNEIPISIVISIAIIIIACIIPKKAPTSF
jgi:hypothetical protein